ncbi:MAG: hypothetical protein M0R77_20625 [Gammaproteobacteria bacterium]|nr:hypothetical protein [Gammaproteobacteria bacterium]
MPIIYEPKPETWQDAVFRICSNLNDEEIKTLKENSYALFHHGLGTSIRNNWDLWDETSSLYKSFQNDLGLTHADDMSGIILRSAEATAKGEPVQCKEWAGEYLKYWEQCNK